MLSGLDNRCRRWPARRIGRWAPAATIATLATLAAAPAADGEGYQARFCDSTVAGSLPAEERGFYRAGALPKFNMSNLCPHRDEGGLDVRVAPSAAAPDQFGGWFIDVLPAVAIQGVSFRARGVGADARTPRVIGSFPGATSEALVYADTLASHFQLYERSGDFERFGVMLFCNTKSGNNCPDVTTSTASAAIKDITFTVADSGPPTVELTGGTLLSGPIQRDVQDLSFRAADTDSGIDELVVRVNGKRVHQVDNSCTVEQGLALAIPPCPGVEGAIALDTRAEPFRPGRNRLVVCARDWAPANPTEVCTPPHMMRVQNGCPTNAVFPADQGRELSLAFGGGKRAVKVRQGKRPRLAATIRDAAGAAVGGARVCIWEQHEGAPRERLISQGVTNSNGIASVRLPKGPNRALRATYWYADAEHVLTARADVEVRPRVGLRLRPSGTLRNGDRMLLRARLGGPYQRGRRTCFFVRQPHRDYRLGCDRTGRDGVARQHWKFRTVQGSARFRFYATVPEQRGYPYAKGTSKLRTKRVVG